jgi:serine/threonine protein kinase
VQALDFLDKLLRYDHQDRLTAREAMVIPIFGLSARLYLSVWFNRWAQTYPIQSFLKHVESRAMGREGVHKMHALEMPSLSSIQTQNSSTWIL